MSGENGGGLEVVLVALIAGDGADNDVGNSHRAAQYLEITP